MGFFLSLAFIIAVVTTVYRRMTATEEATSQERVVNGIIMAVMITAFVGLVGLFIFG